MTLNTKFIEKEALKLYDQYLKNPRIPDDLCSDIYLEFVRRMKKYKESQTIPPRSLNDIGPIIGNLIKLATLHIFHRYTKEKREEAQLMDVVKKNISQFWAKGKSQEEVQFFERIAFFLKKWSSKRKTYPQYLHIFILYHSYHLSPAFIESLCPYTGIDPLLLESQVGIIKEAIHLRINQEVDRRFNSLGIHYYHLVKEQYRVGGLKLNVESGSSREIAQRKQKRKQALNVIHQLKPVPQFQEIAAIVGIPSHAVSYGYRVINKAILEAFKDDTYWGEG
ncbi:hypothetical protein [Spirochaeta cellobiosiphila]|uniref:hypothetical protein n=1 Tax=Spirochaeta cellobiosiphila TaxID=504483 RepID=UPI00041E6FB4|nr:hypothetical protein [Spirochaeta cellobiosiphila]